MVITGGLITIQSVELPPVNKLVCLCCSQLGHEMVNLM